MLIFSTPVWIRHLWQLKSVVFMHWCLICAVLLSLVITIYNCKIFIVEATGQRWRSVDTSIIYTKLTSLNIHRNQWWTNNRLPFQLCWKRKLLQLATRVTRRIEKNCQNFQRIAQKVAKSKRSKYLQQTSIWKSKTSTSNHF